MTVSACGNVRGGLKYNVITLNPGTYTLTQTIGGSAGWARDLTIQGANSASGSSPAILDGGGTKRHLKAVSGSAIMLRNLKLINGVSAAPHAGYGGSIYVDGGTVTTEGCSFQTNAATGISYPEGGVI